MYQRALQGDEKTWGLDHTSTLDTVNSLGSLYYSQGRLDEAEKMFQRALQSFENTCNLEHTLVRNVLGGLYEIYCRRCVSLRQELRVRQEQRARHRANLANPNRDKQARDTIFAVANLCEKFGAVWPPFFTIPG
jgi:tetratricopeptide (TPR) repeat protein